MMIKGGYGKAFRLSAGQALRIINTEGTQVVDCWAWNVNDLHEHMSMETSRVWLQRLNPIVGDTFVTTKRNPILTVVEDTSPGIHDTFMACCDAQRYRLLDFIGHHRNCLDNMFSAMRAIHQTPPQAIYASFNIFMNIEVLDDGRSLATKPTPCRPSDYITLRSEMDCYVALSACPQDIVPIQGRADLTPQDIHVDTVDDDFEEIPVRQSWVPQELLR